MPRNGSGVFSKPSGTTALPNTEIESAKFNQVIDDFVSDANTARPIVAGGTGAASASAARTSLGLVIGTDVEAKNAILTDIGAITPTDGVFLVGNGTTFVGESGSVARTSLGIPVLVDDDTFATATATNVASAESVKTYVDGQIDGQALGVGQTWTDVLTTPGRALNTVYTNTTGRTIDVSISCTFTDDGVDLQVGGVVVARHETGSGTGVHIVTLETRVPPGATYQAVTTTGAATLSNWSELR